MHLFLSALGLEQFEPPGTPHWPMSDLARLSGRQYDAEGQGSEGGCLQSSGPSGCMAMRPFSGGGQR